MAEHYEPPPTGYDYDAPPPPAPSPTTHVKVIIIVVPIVGVVCLGLLAALLFVLCIRRRRRRCPDVEEETKVDEVEDVEVKVTEHVRIVEGVVGEAGEVEASCGGGVVEAGAGAVAVAGGIVVEDDVKVEEHVVRLTEASKRERE
ncbi:unnamed protein product [Urochloa humidicola]